MWRVSSLLSRPSVPNWAGMKLEAWSQTRTTGLRPLRFVVRTELDGSCGASRVFSISLSPWRCNVCYVFSVFAPLRMISYTLLLFVKRVFGQRRHVRQKQGETGPRRHPPAQGAGHGQQHRRADRRPDRQYAGRRAACRADAGRQLSADRAEDGRRLFGAGRRQFADHPALRLPPRLPELSRVPVRAAGRTRGPVAVARSRARFRPAPLPRGISPALEATLENIRETFRHISDKQLARHRDAAFQPARQDLPGRRPLHRSDRPLHGGPPRPSSGPTCFTSPARKATGATA